MTNQTFTISLDFSHELTFGQLLDDIQDYYLTAQIVELCGPAGGNPLISLSSPNISDLILYLKEKYLSEFPEDLDFYMQQIIVT